MKIRVHYIVEIEKNISSFNELLDVRSKFIEEEAYLLLKTKWDNILNVNYNLHIIVADEQINVFKAEDIKYMFKIGLNIGQISAITNWDEEEIYYID